MFHVLDHASVVYSGNLSESTRYVVDHYGKKLDEAIRSGIRILYTDASHGLSDAARTALAAHPAKFRQPGDRATKSTLHTH